MALDSRWQAILPELSGEALPTGATFMTLWNVITFSSTGVCLASFIALLWLRQSSVKLLREQQGLLLSMDIKIAQLEVATKRYTAEAERYERALVAWKR
jgi:hypothetical protein